MDLTFSEEQKMLRASLRRFLDDRYPFKLRYAASRSAHGLPDGIWSDLANELGILGAGISERHGGFGGGPVGLSTLAVSLGEEAETVEVVAEPFLVRCGLLARTPRGRVATAAGWAHLGLAPPASLAELPTLFD